MGWLTSKQLVEGLLFSRPAAFRIFVNHFQSFDSFGLLTVTFGVLKIVVGCSKVTVGCLRLDSVVVLDWGWLGWIWLELLGLGWVGLVCVGVGLVKLE